VGGVAVSGNVPVAVGQEAFFNNTDDGLGNFPLNTITYSGALPTISDTSYTLTVALGVPSGQVADYKLSLLVDGSPTYATATVDSANFGLAGSGTTATGNGYTNFYDFSVTLSAATIEADGLVGKQLGVQLGSQEISPDFPYSHGGAFSQTYFSDVRLVPEPSTFALVGLAGGFGLLFLRGRMRRSAV
jgi:hypothetical protein